MERVFAHFQLESTGLNQGNDPCPPDFNVGRAAFTLDQLAVVRPYSRDTRFSIRYLYQLGYGADTAPTGFEPALSRMKLGAHGESRTRRTYLLRIVRMPIPSQGQKTLVHVTGVEPATSTF
jgi:hypothetical protein